MQKTRLSLILLMKQSYRLSCDRTPLVILRWNIVYCFLTSILSKSLTTYHPHTNYQLMKDSIDQHKQSCSTLSMWLGGEGWGGGQSSVESKCHHEVLYTLTLTFRMIVFILKSRYFPNSVEGQQLDWANKNKQDFFGVKINVLAKCNKNKN